MLFPKDSPHYQLGEKQGKEMQVVHCLIESKKAEWLEAQILWCKTYERHVREWEELNHQKLKPMIKPSVN